MEKARYSEITDANSKKFHIYDENYDFYINY